MVSTLLDGLDPAALARTGFEALLSLLLDKADPEPGVVTWSLTAIDQVAANSGINLFGDGEPADVQVQAPSQVTQSAGFMTDKTATTPQSSGAMNVSVEHVFDSVDREHNLAPITAVLELMRRSMKSLRRRPRMLFEYGHLSVPVWLVDYQFSPFEGYWPGTKHPRRLRVSFQLVEANTHSLKLASSKPAETTWLKIPAGHTFELLAAMKYGDPALGVLLRRTNPEVIEEKAGQLIRMLEPEHPLMNEPLGPQAPAFAERFAELLQEKAESKLGREAKSWDNFEDLIDIEADAPTLWG